MEGKKAVWLFIFILFFNVKFTMGPKYEKPDYAYSAFFSSSPPVARV